MAAHETPIFTGDGFTLHARNATIPVTYYLQFNTPKEGRTWLPISEADMRGMLSAFTSNVLNNAPFRP